MFKSFLSSLAIHYRKMYKTWCQLIHSQAGDLWESSNIHQKKQSHRGQKVMKAAITVSYCDHVERINCRMIERRYRKGKLTKLRARTVNEKNMNLLQLWQSINVLTQITTNSTQFQMFPKSKIQNNYVYEMCLTFSRVRCFLSPEKYNEYLSQLLDILQHIIRFSCKPTIRTLLPLILHKVNMCLF